MKPPALEDGDDAVLLDGRSVATPISKWVVRDDDVQLLYVGLRGRADGLKASVRLPEGTAPALIVTEGVELVVRSLEASLVAVQASSNGRIVLENCQIERLHVWEGEILVRDGCRLEAVSGRANRFACMRSAVFAADDDPLLVADVAAVDRPFDGALVYNIALPEDPATLTRIAVAGMDAIVFDPCLPELNPELIDDSVCDAQMMLAQVLRERCPDSSKVAEQIRRYYRVRSRSSGKSEQVLLAIFRMLGHGVEPLRAFVSLLVAAFLLLTAICVSNLLRDADWKFGLGHLRETVSLYLSIIGAPISSFRPDLLPADLRDLPSWALAGCQIVLGTCYAFIVLGLQARVRALSKLRRR